MILFTDDFIREFFGIPDKYKLFPVVIEEHHKDGDGNERIEYDLGVRLVGTHKVVNLFKRNFAQDEVKTRKLTRKVYNAKFERQTDGYAVFSSEIGELFVNEDEFTSEYFKSKYSDKLMSTFIL